MLKDVETATRAYIDAEYKDIQREISRCKASFIKLYTRRAPDSD